MPRAAKSVLEACNTRALVASAAWLRIVEVYGLDLFFILDVVYCIEYIGVHTNRLSSWRCPMESMSAVQLWSGRILSGLAVIFLFVDAIGKLFRVAPVVKGTMELGYQENVVFPLGVLLLIGVLLYAMPWTSLIGAIYLTAFLGGAVATHVRVGSPLTTHVLFGVYVAVFLWGGLALRTPRLMNLLTGAH
jgi:hypothetical protein